MDLRIRLSGQLGQTLIARLATAHRCGQLRLYRRIQALLHIVQGKAVSEVAELLDLAEQTVRNYVHSFILQAAGEVLEVAPAPRSVRRLAGDHLGLRIRRAGAVLRITQEGGPADYWLGAGEQCTVTRPGLVVLQGMENW
jgi:hypothetical protein